MQNMNVCPFLSTCLRTINNCLNGLSFGIDLIWLLQQWTQTIYATMWMFYAFKRKLQGLVLGLFCRENNTTQALSLLVMKRRFLTEAELDSFVFPQHNMCICLICDRGRYYINVLRYCSRLIDKYKHQK